MERLAAAIRPDLPANARFVIEDEKQSPRSNPVYLFRNGLWLITPLSWLVFGLNLMGFFFLISWTPTLLTAAKLPPATAALAGGLLQGGGAVGALALSAWVQRHRFLGLSLLFLLAVRLSPRSAMRALPAGAPCWRRRSAPDSWWSESRSASTRSAR